MRYLLLLALVACGPRSAVDTPAGEPPPPDAAPIGPGPKVSWMGDHFETRDLPAMSKDGTKFVYAYERESSYPNLSLIVKDAVDFAGHELKVLEIPADPLALDGPSEPTFENVEGANRFLADGYAVYEWQAMIPAEVEGGIASLGSVEIQLTDAHLTVRDAGAVVYEVDVPKWLDTTCKAPPVLSEAWIALERAGSLLRIGCQMHVFVWR
jgi:hypothetical protein